MTAEAMTAAGQSGSGGEADAQRRFAAALAEACADLGLTLASGVADVMWEHWRRVQEANRRFNLTRVSDPEEAAVKIVADSLAVLAWPGSAALPQRLLVLDVGTGAGYPAVPVALLRPGWRVVAIDATAKKARFVADTVRALGIGNVEAVHARASHWRDWRTYGLILLRAVGPLAECIRQARRHAAPGGLLVCYKTSHMPEEEMEAGLEAARKANIDLVERWAYPLRLAGEDQHRVLVILRAGG